MRWIQRNQFASIPDAITWAESAAHGECVVPISGWHVGVKLSRNLNGEWKWNYGIGESAQLPKYGVIIQFLDGEKEHRWYTNHKHDAKTAAELAFHFTKYNHGRDPLTNRPCQFKAEPIPVGAHY